MTAPTVLISGAGIAGPAAAHWLHRVGYRPTVIERAPSPRTGGYAVDFRGHVHLGILTKMGVLDAIHARRTDLASLTFVDAASQPQAQMPAAIFAGDVEIARGDLAEVLREATEQHTEYRFGDAIAGLVERDGGVEVEFQSGTRRTFDLVVGADGLRSGVRALAFPGANTADLGVYSAIFSVPNTLGLDRAGLIYSEPGRSVYLCATRCPDTAVAVLHFTADSAPAGGVAAQKAAVAAEFGRSGWVVPELLAVLADAPDFYLGPASQVHAPSWSSGRVVLLGDAAWAAGNGGNGTGTAVVGAYVLAGELAAARGDHRTAFAGYERVLRPYATRGQKQAASGVRFHVPAAQRDIDRRNRFFRLSRRLPVGGLIGRLATRSATAIALPDYDLEPVPSSAVTEAR